MGIGNKGLLQLSSLASIGKILDQFGRRGTESLKAILDGAIANGHGEMRFSSTLFAIEDQRASFDNEVRAQVGSEQGLLERTLQSEIKLIDGLEEGEVGFTGKTL